MQTLHAALVGVDLDRRIKISTPHSLGILSTSNPPSNGIFRLGYDIHVLKPLLSFLRSTSSPFIVNPYPFFGCTAENVDYALFKPNPGMRDENKNLIYTNMLDAQLDAVFSAMKVLGFDDLEIVIAEICWPSLGDSTQIAVDERSAGGYNRNLMRHVESGANRTFETYIFSLFNEDLKPGPTCERNFGLFRPNMTAVCDIGLLRPAVAAAAYPNLEPFTRWLLITIGLLVLNICGGKYIIFSDHLKLGISDLGLSIRGVHFHELSARARDDVERADDGALRRNVGYGCGWVVNTVRRGPCFPKIQGSDNLRI